MLFIPESIWTAIGINGSDQAQHLPSFAQYYVKNSGFQNAMFIFWLSSPFVLLINTVLFFIHLNFQGYPAYLQRRSLRLKKQGKTHDYSLIAGLVAFLVAYMWGTGIYLSEPAIFGSFVPAKSRLAMLLIHVAVITYLMPALLTMLATELRASFFDSARFKV